MEKIKIDRPRKEIVLKQRVFKGVAKRVKGKFLSNLPGNFDSDLSEFTNRSGFTYVFSNPPKEEEVEEFVEVKSKVTIEEKLKNAYFAGLDDASKAEIAEIKEDYNL